MKKKKDILVSLKGGEGEEQPGESTCPPPPAVNHGSNRELHGKAMVT